MPVSEQQLIGDLLPTIHFKRITLESRQKVSQKKDNPHITEENVQFDPPPASPSTQGMKVTIDFVINEVFKKGFISTWFDDDMIKKYVKVKVIQITNPSISSVFSNSSRSIAYALSGIDWSLPSATIDILKSNLGIGDTRTLKKIFLDSVEEKTLSLQLDMNGEQGTMADKISAKNENGNKVVKMSLRTSFDVDTQNPEHISYFAVSYLDLEALQEEFDIKFSANPNQVLNGEVKSETVFDQGKAISTSFMFLTPDNKPWPGPVFQQAGEWKTGISDSPQSQYLTVRRIPNSKLQDFRNFAEIEKYKIDLSFINNDLSQRVNGALSFKNDKMLQEKSKSYFSNIQIARSRSGAAHFVFDFDLFETLKGESSMRKLYQTTNPSSSQYIKSMVNRATIKRMSILRRRVENIKSQNELGTPYEAEKVFDDEIPYSVLGIKGGGLNIRQANIFDNQSASLKSYNPAFSSSLNPFGITSFTGTDKEMINITDGFYQYGVELEIEDVTVKYIRSRLTNLRKLLKEMDKYYERSVQTGFTNYILNVKNPHIGEVFTGPASTPSNSKSAANYNSLLNSFTPKFAKIERQAFGTPNKHPRVRAISEYVQLLKLFTPIEQVGAPSLEQLQECLLIVSSPKTGTPEGISKVIKVIQGLVKKIDALVTPSQMQDNAGMFSQEVSQNQPASSASAAAYSNIIKIKHWFTNEEFDSDLQKNYGLDYLLFDNTSLKEAITEVVLNSDPGLRYVSQNDFISRVRRESLKYFKIDRPDVGSLFDGDSLQTTSFTYFSPNVCFLGDESFLLSKTPDPTSLAQFSANKNFSYDYYSLLESKIARFNSRGYPVPKERSYSTKEYNLDTQLYRKTMQSLFADLGLRIEAPDGEEILPLTEQGILPIPEQQKTGLKVIAQSIDPIFPEKKFKPNEAEAKISNINPNTLFLAISRPYYQSGFFLNKNSGIDKTLRVKNKKMKVMGESTEKTLLEYNIRNNNNFISRMLSSEKYRNMFFSDLGIDPSTVSILSKKITQNDLNKYLVRLPNQIKALILSSKFYDSSVLIDNFFDNSDSALQNSEQESKNPKPNSLKDPLLMSYFNFRYGMLNKIEVLNGYEKKDSLSGRMINPVWVPLTEERWQSYAFSETSSGKMLRCRMKKFEMSSTKLKREKSVELPIYDEYFLLEAPKPGPQLPLPPPSPEDNEPDPIIKVKTKIIDEVDPETSSTNIITATITPEFCPPFRKNKK